MRRRVVWAPGRLIPLRTMAFRIIPRNCNWMICLRNMMDAVRGEVEVGLPG